MFHSDVGMRVGDTLGAGCSPDVLRDSKALSRDTSDIVESALARKSGNLTLLISCPCGLSPWCEPILTGL